MERKWTRNFIWCTAVFTAKLETSTNFNFTILLPSASFCARNEKACGRQPEKIIRDQESVWDSIYEVLFAKCSTLTNSESFHPRKFPSIRSPRSMCVSPRPRTTWNANSSENPVRYQVLVFAVVLKGCQLSFNKSAPHLQDAL